MPAPATGVSFAASGLAYLNSLRVRRGGRWSVLVRDYNGAATNISPGSTFGAPLAIDGTWRSDLMAIVKNASGHWIYNSSSNLGFYPLGFIHPDGIERDPKISSDPLEGLQTLDPIRVDIQKRDKTVMFTPLERNLVVDAIRFNQPLANVLERADTSGAYFVGESSDDQPIRRQVLICHEDRMGGLVERNVFPFPRCVLTDLGSEKGNKKDADAARFTLSREIDPYFTDANGVPLLDGRWTAGSLWDQDTSYGVSFTSTPVVTALTSTTAKVTFSSPVGGTTPYTYTVQKSANGESGWTSVTAAAPTVSGGVVTINLSALTSGATNYFRVNLTDAASGTATSAVSNSVTQP